jgi:hypothetical protein
VGNRPAGWLPDAPSMHSLALSRGYVATPAECNGECNVAALERSSGSSLGAIRVRGGAGSEFLERLPFGALRGTVIEHAPEAALVGGEASHEPRGNGEGGGEGWGAGLRAPEAADDGEFEIAAPAAEHAPRHGEAVALADTQLLEVVEDCGASDEGTFLVARGGAKHCV